MFNVGVTVNPSHLARLIDLGGWKRADFAKEVGISPQYLGDILSGRSKLKRSPRLVADMARVLNVPRTMLEQPIEGVAS